MKDWGKRIGRFQVPWPHIESKITLNSIAHLSLFQCSQSSTIVLLHCMSIVIVSLLLFEEIQAKHLVLHYHIQVLDTLSSWIAEIDWNGSQGLWSICSLALSIVHFLHLSMYMCVFGRNRWNRMDGRNNWENTHIWDSDIPSEMSLKKLIIGTTQNIAYIF